MFCSLEPRKDENKFDALRKKPEKTEAVADPNKGKETAATTTTTTTAGKGRFGGFESAKDKEKPQGKFGGMRNEKPQEKSSGGGADQGVWRSVKK